jgi:hypothetical protein
MGSQLLPFELQTLKLKKDAAILLTQFANFAMVLPKVDLKTVCFLVHEFMEKRHLTV